MATDDTPAKPGTLQVPAVWVGTEQLPVEYANQFVAVIQPGEVFVSFGTFVPPPLAGATVQEREIEAQNIAFVQIKPVARIALSPKGLRELARVLQDTLTNLERMEATT